MDLILILDFGGQTSQLIARRVRENGFYTEIIPGDMDFRDLHKRIALENIKGFILSGSPFSVGDEDAPILDPAFLEAGLPVLGICYGIQRIIHQSGGTVKSAGSREYGSSKVPIPVSEGLFHNIPDSIQAWMSHGDSIVEIPEEFQLISQSEHGAAAVIAHTSKEIYGLQFHPEVSHCEFGSEILANFANMVCGAKGGWSMEAYLREVGLRIREQASKRQVLLLISGGVDSTVVAALLLQELDPALVHLMYIDTGMMRSGETEEVRDILTGLGAQNLHIIHAEQEFLHALEGVSDPEEKRRIIGDQFITIQTRELEKLGIDNALLAQGTLYTDLIESGSGVGNKASTIKSHHNVSTPLVAQKRALGELLEPLDRLYKDEVRLLGELLGLPRDRTHRHPFPGPGLAIRIPGAVDRQKLDVLRQVDRIYLEELRKRGLYDQIWQAFAVLLPVRSVGVTGDQRNFAYVCALRAVDSSDGMSADVYQMNYRDLLEISNRITNEVRDIGRVTYDISSKPPATIEWE